ncbi:sugar ABC transporter ATP-binding protein [Streptococcus troglodytae]|uniref:Sugar ABC transporter ATP-binding protein n=1 Tax=Streptococcus troglodytae TaxID=1111760 RepID=A0A1L7LJ76_9STRE|nr:sugar ABC transporter ATP-binding protein [Streptococcus troglodytae]
MLDKGVMACKELFKLRTDAPTKTIRLKEEIAAVDIGFNIDKSHIGYLLAKIAHHKLVLATNIDTS